MTDEQEKPQRAFKVEDRRRFSETGDLRAPETSASDPTEEPAAAPSTPQPDAAPEHARTAPGHGVDDVGYGIGEGKGEPVITFATFVLSLSTQALAHLGEIPDPIDHSTRVDLSAARQIIDIIAMLRDKTRGNLDEAEKALLENALYDLRMRYVELAQQR